MLDHRVYRAAFLPALVVLMLAAFSLTDRPAPSTTRLAPDALDPVRMAELIDELAEAYPRRLPGSPADTALAARVARRFAATGFASGDSIRMETLSARTVAGRTELRVVLGERLGLSGRRIVVLAHRDALAGAPSTTLSGTAMLLELARILADRDLTWTVVLASVSGGTGGYAGARRAIELVGGPVDAVLVLGDLASERTRRPFVVPWSASGDPGPHALRRTVETAIGEEIGQDPGSVRPAAQWARRAVPVTVSEQGVVAAAGAPAVLVSATGELGPRRGDELSMARLRTFGRGVLRAYSAIEGARPARESASARRSFTGADGIVLRGRLLPEWAIRLSVLALLVPALFTALDAVFRVRRRGGGPWWRWAATLALPFLLAWAWLRLLGITGAVQALPAPAPPGNIELGAGPAVALGSVGLVLLAGFAGARPWLLERAGARPHVAGAPGATVALLTGALTLGVWFFNPYAAAVLLPAAHLWLLVPAPESRLRGMPAVVAVLGGLVMPAMLVAYFAVTLDLRLTEFLRLTFDLVAGGEAGLLDALSLSLLAGLSVGALLALRHRATAAPEDSYRGGPGARSQPRIRGPLSYAGPGSLGGTGSALRR